MRDSANFSSYRYLHYKHCVFIWIISENVKLLYCAVMRSPTGFFFVFFFFTHPDRVFLERYKLINGEEKKKTKTKRVHSGWSIAHNSPVHTHNVIKRAIIINRKCLARIIFGRGKANEYKLYRLFSSKKRCKARIACFSHRVLDNIIILSSW